jgi:hypothetical protein
MLVTLGKILTDLKAKDLLSTRRVEIRCHVEENYPLTINLAERAPEDRSSSIINVSNSGFRIEIPEELSFWLRKYKKFIVQYANEQIELDGKVIFLSAVQGGTQIGVLLDQKDEPDLALRYFQYILPVLIGQTLDFPQRLDHKDKIDKCLRLSGYNGSSLKLWFEGDEINEYSAIDTLEFSMELLVLRAQVGGQSWQVYQMKNRDAQILTQKAPDDVAAAFCQLWIKVSLALPPTKLPTLKNFLKPFEEGSRQTA